MISNFLKLIVAALFISHNAQALQDTTSSSVQNTISSAAQKTKSSKLAEVKLNEVLIKNAKGLNLPSVLVKRLQQDLNVSLVNISKQNGVQGDLKIRLEKDLNLTYCSKGAQTSREISVSILLKDKKQAAYLVAPQINFLEMGDYKGLFLNKGVQLRNAEFKFKDDSFITHRLTNLFVNHFSSLMSYVTVSFSQFGVYVHAGQNNAYSILNFALEGQENQLAYGSCQ